MSDDEVGDIERELEEKLNLLEATTERIQKLKQRLQKSTPIQALPPSSNYYTSDTFPSEPPDSSNYTPNLLDQSDPSPYSSLAASPYSLASPAPSTDTPQFSDEETAPSLEEKVKLSGWDERFKKLRAIQYPNIKDYQEFSSLSDEFSKTAATYIKMIVGEQHLPEKSKKLQPIDVGGQAGGTKYEVHGLFFKYPVDKMVLPGIFIYGGNNRDDVSATKASNHDLKGEIYFMMADEENFFQVPLSALVDYQGYRLHVQTTLPIAPDSLIYGSADAGKSVQRDDDIHTKLKVIAKELNLRPHLVSESAVEMAFCGDLEVHRFTSGDKESYYLLDAARLFPPDPSHWKKPNSPAGSPFFRLLRPELVKSFEHPLSSDAGTKWQSKDPNSPEMFDHLEQAHKVLLKNCEDLAIELSKDKKVITSTIEQVTKTFMKDVPIKDKFVAKLHSRGINIRYVGLLLYHVHKQENPDKTLIAFLNSFMILRSIKNMWQTRIRKNASGNQMVYVICLEETLKIFNSLVYLKSTSNSQQNTEFLLSLQPYISYAFANGILTNDEKNELFNHLQPSELLKEGNIITLLEWIVLRLCHLCGILLNDDAIQSLLSKDKYLFIRTDVIDFIPVIRSLPIFDYLAVKDLLRQAKSIKLPAGKVPLLKAASGKLQAIQQYGYPGVKKYLAKTSLQLMQLDKNFFVDTSEVIGTLKENYHIKKTVKSYYNYFCSVVWKQFLQMEPIKVNYDEQEFLMYLRINKWQEIKRVKEDYLKPLSSPIHEEWKKLCFAIGMEKDEFISFQYNLLSAADWTSTEKKPEYFALWKGIEQCENILSKVKEEMGADWSEEALLEFEKPEIFLQLLEESQSWSIDHAKKNWFFRTFFVVDIKEIIEKYVSQFPEPKKANFVELISSTWFGSQDPVTSAVFTYGMETAKLFADCGFSRVPLQVMLCDKAKRISTHFRIKLSVENFKLWNLIVFSFPYPSVTKLLVYVEIDLLESNPTLWDANSYSLMSVVRDDSFHKNQNPIFTLIGSPTVFVNADRPRISLSIGGSLEGIEHLIKAKVNVNYINQEGYFPLMFCSSKKQIKKLLKNGADINLQNKEGKTALIHTVEYNMMHAATVLIEKNANLEVKDKDGDTALVYAIQRRELDLLNLLISKGANVDTENKKAETPLSFCLKNGEIDTFKLLISAGAKLDYKNKDGKTILNIAEEKGWLNLYHSQITKCPELEPFKEISKKDCIEQVLSFLTTYWTDVQTKFQNIWQATLGMTYTRRLISSSLTMEEMPNFYRMINRRWNARKLKKMDIFCENEVSFICFLLHTYKKSFVDFVKQSQVVSYSETYVRFRDQLFALLKTNSTLKELRMDHLSIQEEISQLEVQEESVGSFRRNKEEEKENITNQITIISNELTALEGQIKTNEVKKAELEAKASAGGVSGMRAKVDIPRVEETLLKAKNELEKNTKSLHYYQKILESIQKELNECGGNAAEFNKQKAIRTEILQKIANLTTQLADQHQQLQTSITTLTPQNPPETIIQGWIKQTLAELNHNLLYFQKYDGQGANLSF